MGGWQSAECLGHLVHQVRLLYPQPQSLEVGERPYGFGRGIDRAGAGIIKGQASTTIVDPIPATKANAA
jgi:hypothetical protein